MTVSASVHTLVEPLLHRIHARIRTDVIFLNPDFRLRVFPPSRNCALKRGTRNAESAENAYSMYGSVSPICLGLQHRRGSVPRNARRPAYDRAARSAMGGGSPD